MRGPTKGRRAVGYARVSTDEQAQEGVSLDAQAERIRQYCELYGLELVEVVRDEGYTGTNMRRPGWRRVLQLHHDKVVELVVVVDLDRISRSVPDFSRLLSRMGAGSGQFADGGLICINQNFDAQTPAGRLVAHVLASFSQYESEQIGRRTSAALGQKRREGRTTGRAPYGWRADSEGVLHPDPDEQPVLRAMLRARKRGDSYRAVAHLLNGRGHTNRHGRPWNHRMVRLIITGHEERAAEGAPTSIEVRV